MFCYPPVCVHSVYNIFSPVKYNFFSVIKNFIEKMEALIKSGRKD